MQKPYCTLAGMEYRRILEEMSQFDITEYQLNLQWYRLQGICFANRNALQYLQVLEKKKRTAGSRLASWRQLFQNKSKTLDLNGYHFLKTDFYWYLPIETNSLILSTKRGTAFLVGTVIYGTALTCPKSRWEYHVQKKSMAPSYAMNFPDLPRLFFILPIFPKDQQMEVLGTFTLG